MPDIGQVSTIAPPTVCSNGYKVDFQSVLSFFSIQKSDFLSTEVQAELLDEIYKINAGRQRELSTERDFLNFLRKVIWNVTSRRSDSASLALGAWAFESPGFIQLVTMANLQPRLDANNGYGRIIDIYDSILTSLPTNGINALEYSADVKYLSNRFRQGYRLYILKQYAFRYFWYVSHKTGFKPYSLISWMSDNVKERDANTIDVENMSLSFRKFLRAVVGRYKGADPRLFAEIDGYPGDVGLKAKYSLVSALSHGISDDELEGIEFITLFHLLPESFDPLVAQVWDYSGFVNYVTSLFVEYRLTVPAHVDLPRIFIFAHEVHSEIELEHTHWKQVNTFPFFGSAHDAREFCASRNSLLLPVNGNAASTAILQRLTQDVAKVHGAEAVKLWLPFEKLQGIWTHMHSQRQYCMSVTDWTWKMGTGDCVSYQFPDFSATTDACSGFRFLTCIGDWENNIGNDDSYSRVVCNDKGYPVDFEGAMDFSGLPIPHLKTKLLDALYSGFPTAGLTLTDDRSIYLYVRQIVWKLVTSDQIYDVSPPSDVFGLGDEPANFQTPAELIGFITSLFDKIPGDFPSDALNGELGEANYDNPAAFLPVITGILENIPGDLLGSILGAFGGLGDGSTNLEDLAAFTPIITSIFENIPGDLLGNIFNTLGDLGDGSANLDDLASFIPIITSFFEKISGDLSVNSPNGDLGGRPANLDNPAAFIPIITVILEKILSDLPDHILNGNIGDGSVNLDDPTVLIAVVTSILEKILNDLPGHILHVDNADVIIVIITSIFENIFNRLPDQILDGNFGDGSVDLGTPAGIIIIVTGIFEDILSNLPDLLGDIPSGDLGASSASLDNPAELITIITRVFETILTELPGHILSSNLGDGSINLDDPAIRIVVITRIFENILRDLPGHIGHLAIIHPPIIAIITSIFEKILNDLPDLILNGDFGDGSVDLGTPAGLIIIITSIFENIFHELPGIILNGEFGYGSNFDNPVAFNPNTGNIPDNFPGHIFTGGLGDGPANLNDFAAFIPIITSIFESIPGDLLDNILNGDLGDGSANLDDPAAFIPIITIIFEKILSDLPDHIFNSDLGDGSVNLDDPTVLIAVVTSILEKILNDLPGHILHVDNADVIIVIITSIFENIFNRLPDQILDGNFGDGSVDLGTPAGVIIIVTGIFEEILSNLSDRIVNAIGERLESFASDLDFAQQGSSGGQIGDEIRDEWYIRNLIFESPGYLEFISATAVRSYFDEIGETADWSDIFGALGQTPIPSKYSKPIAFLADLHNVKFFLVKGNPKKLI